MNGTDVLLFVNTGTINSPTYVAVGSQRNTTITKTMATMDASSKDSDDENPEPGRLGSTVSLDGVYVPSDVAQRLIDTTYKSKGLLLIEVQENGVETETAPAYITSFVKNHPDQDVSTFTIDLMVKGGWTEAGT
jgi:TP901-1 family phage major tail protein